MKSKIKGAIYGVAVGDAMGAPWEGWRPKDIQLKFGTVKDLTAFDTRVNEEEHYGWSFGEFTDDTWLTLATARAYDGDTFSPEKAGLAMVIWMRTIGKGIGRLTNTALSNLSSGRCDVYTAGKKALASMGNRGASNGSLMKCISTGLVNIDAETIIKESRVLSEITHADSRCVAACVGYNTVVGKLMAGANVMNALEAGRQAVEFEPETYAIFDNACNGGDSMFDPSVMKEIGFVLRALDRALIAVRDAITFENEMIKVVNEGGDTDTNAAIAGGLLGVRFGYDDIPERWIKPLLNKDELDEAVELIEKYRR